MRHGEKIRVPGDPPLSAIGKKQALVTARYLNNFQISKVYSSPILRTLQTATYIAEILQVPLEIDDLLRERVNWGDDPSQSFDDFLAMWIKALHEREWQPPVGDSSVTTGRRLENMIKKLRQEKDDNVVLAAHGGIITDFLRNVFPLETLCRFVSDFETTLDKNIKECSITLVEAGPNHPILQIKQLGYTGHLRDV